MGARRKKSRKRSGTKTGGKPREQVTFFIGRSLGKRVGEALSGAGETVELQHAHFGDKTPDVEWMSAVGARGWVVLTKDKAIHRNPIERLAVVASNLRLFALSGGNLDGEQMAAIFLRHRARIGRFARKYAPPFVALVSESGVNHSPGFQKWYAGTLLEKAQGEVPQPEPSE